jgi:putative ABC transport system permease protein
VNVPTFILKNALRNKRRLLLSVLSVAASMFLLVALMVALREMTMPPEALGAALRVAVRNKISITMPLPARQKAIIERIPGVEAITPFSWFGGKYKNEGAMSFAQFAVEPEGMRKLFVESKMPSTQQSAFAKEKTGCILGKVTAEKYGLKVGDKFQLESTVYPVTMAFKVVGIYYGTPDDRNMYFRQDYLDDSIGKPGVVGMWWIKVKSPEDMQPVVAAINAKFANTSAEVRAESERAFQLGFISMWGNIKILVTSICSVVVFTLVLVSASTMSMAIRERFRELAILKAIGFQRRELFVFILAESFALAVAGGALGIGAAYLAFTYSDVPRWTHQIFLSLEVTPKIIGVASLVAVALGIIASIAPGLAVARMSVVSGLKTLD